MTLNRKFILLGTLIVATCFALAAGVMYFVVMPGFKEVEHTQAQRDITRCLDCVANDIDRLAVSGRDYAYWDDMYSLVEAGDLAAAESNFADDMFANIDIDLVLLVLPNGEVFFRKQAPLALEALNHQEIIASSWPSPAVFSGGWHEAEQRVGLKAIGQDLFSIVAFPVRENGKEAPANGVLIFCRRLTPERIAKYQKLVQMPFAVHPATGQELAREPARSIPAATNFYQIVRDKGTLDVYALFKGIDGTPAALVHLPLPREVSAIGYTAMLYALAILSAGMGMILALFLAGTYFFVTRNLRTITATLLSLGNGDDRSTILPVSGRDEIGMLAAEFNVLLQKDRMHLDRLEQVVAERTRDLRDSEERLRLALHAANQGIYDLDLRTGDAVVSPEYARMLGYEPDEFYETNAKWIERLHPDDRAITADTYRAYVEGNIPEYRVEFRQQTRSGEWKWMLSLGCIVERDSGGTPLRMLGTHTDITERKHMEELRKVAGERVMRQNEILSQLFVAKEASQGDVPGAAKRVTEAVATAMGIERVGVWLFSENQQELRCLDLFELSQGRHSSGAVLASHQFQAEFEALMSSRYVDAHDPLIDPRTAGYVEGYIKPLHITAMLDGVISIGQRHLGVVCFEHVDRPHQWAEDEIRFVCQVADHLGLVVLNRERRKAEEALVELNRTLGRRVSEEIKLRLEKERMLIYQSKHAAMGEMLGAIAHQWRQPLNTLGLIVQNIRDAFEFGEVSRDFIANSVRNSMDQIRHMSKTIDDFRNFFMPEKERSEFDVLCAVGDVLRLVSAQLSANDIVCRMTCHVEGRTYDQQADIVEHPFRRTSGYRNEFEHVVLNLINNGRDAIIDNRSKAGDDAAPLPPGLLEFNFRRTNGKIVIELSDNGGGIDPAIIDRIFEPYFSTKGPDRGTGLGLYMSKVIIEHMAGSLSAGNSEEGAMFTLMLPAVVVPERRSSAFPR